MPPARKRAELSLSVLLASCSTARLKMAPPIVEATLPLNVLLLIVKVLSSELKIPPPSRVAILPLIVLLTMFNVPAL